MFVVVVKSVEGMEKSFLGGIFTLKKLDVINEQNVDFTVSSLEFWGSVVGNRVDEIVGELFGADVSYAAAFKEADGVVADGVEKVCFAKARAPIDEQRVISLSWGFCYRDSCGVRKPVGRPNNKIVKAIFCVEA